MVLRSIVNTQRFTKGVKCEEMFKNKLNFLPKNIIRRSQLNHLIGYTTSSSQNYSLILRRNYESAPKPEDSERFIYKGIAKCMNTVDAIGSSKDYLLAKRTLGSLGQWFQMAYQKYFIEHWWVQHTIKEFNRKLAVARHARASK